MITLVHRNLSQYSQVGVALFKDHPDALYPFSAMDRSQRLYVEDVVSSCMAMHQRRLASVSSSSAQNVSATGSIINSNRVVMQMGGGCILYVEPCNNNNNGNGVKNAANTSARLKPLDVFEALCDCIFASKR